MNPQLASVSIGSYRSRILQNSYEIQDNPNILSSNNRYYSVSRNAVIVNTAKPLAVALAAELLITNSSLAMEIGKNGRESIMQNFNIHRQMRQYEELYKLVSHRV